VAVDPLDVALAAGAPTVGEAVGAGEPPAVELATCPAVDDAVEVRLLAVPTSDCVVLDAVLVTLWTVEDTALVAVLVALEAVEVAEDTVEPTVEVMPEVLGAWSEGRPEATLIDAPIPIAASSATVRAAAARNERPGMRPSVRLNRSISWNNVKTRKNLRVLLVPTPTETQTGGPERERS
jgi:hypothetical protein